MIDGAETVKHMQERLGAEVMDARAPKPRRAFVRVSRGAFSEAVRHAVFDLGFSHLMAITAAEAGEEMEALYHMACMGATVLTLSVRVPKGDAVLPDISEVMPNAAIYEREAQEMTGIRFEGLKDDSNLVLPKGWPSGVRPLRKDQTYEGLVKVKLDLEKG